MNWTLTGLCTQVNNAVYVKNPDIALGYRERWDALVAAKAAYPASLAKAGSQPTKAASVAASITAWQDPCLQYANLNDAAKYIKNAQQGVLFLMFNPGTGNGKAKAFSLLQDIQQLDTSKFFIHGVVNQDQTAGKAASIQLTHGAKTVTAPVGVITPHALTSTMKTWFSREFQYNMVMIHSKVVVVDPFGSHPIVMTGSDNMGPKASKSNDDNLIIIENAPGLAAEYAVNIMGVYGHYKWLYNAWKFASSQQKVKPSGTKKAPVPVDPRYDGNQDDDKWQSFYTSGTNRLEIDFWLSKG